MTGAGGGALLAALVLVVAACSADPTSDTTSGTAPDATPSSGSTAAPDPTTALRERCLSAMPDDAPVEAFTFEGATGGDIEAARVGPGTNDVVAVLLPQIGGLCGWGRWATGAAEQAGLTSLLVNPCGYGESTCSPEEDADVLNEVSAAVAIAREDLGAERVVLLGTSMGGSLTVIAAAAGVEVDAWADVSGPSAWDGIELATLADDLPEEGLVVMAPSDGLPAFRSARALARAADVPFVAGRNGHGWELLVDPLDGSITRIGRRLLAHVEGPSRA